MSGYREEVKIEQNTRTSSNNSTTLVTNTGTSNTNETLMITELEAININTGGSPIGPGLGFGLEVRAGLIPGVDPFAAHGFIDDLVNNETSISTGMNVNGSGGRTFEFNRSDASNTVHIFSDNALDTDEITVYGWGLNGEEVIQTAFLDGVSDVQLPTAMSNVNRAQFLTGTNVGQILLTSDLPHLNIFMGIGPGENKGFSSVFQVPIGKKLFLTHSNVIASAAGSSQEITIRLRVFPYVVNPSPPPALIPLTDFVGARATLSSGNQYNQFHEGQVALIERTVCAITVERTGGSTMLECYFSLNGVLVDNSLATLVVL